MIEAHELQKSFQITERGEGLGGAVRSLFSPKYRTVHAVRAVSFRVEDGERVAFLGPNGAGKTTTLKMLAGLLNPSGGSARVGGHVPHERSHTFLSSITLVLGQKQQLIWDLPPRETFELNRAIYGVAEASYRAALGELVSVLGIEEVMRKPTRQLSLGERMKCELACALLHAPKYLFLDEPTIGLDVATQQAVREFVAHYNEKHGATVLLTSHYMADVEALCPRVIVIDEGVICFDGAVRALKEKMQPGKNVSLTFERMVPLGELEQMGLAAHVQGNVATFRVPSNDVRGFMASSLQRFDVRDFTVQDPPLEDAIAELLKKSKGGSV